MAASGLDWNPLVPELIVTDLDTSLRFYREIGFSVRFDRPQPRFAYLDLGPVQLMLVETHEHAWVTGDLDHPFGRGLNLQIEVEDAVALAERAVARKHEIFRPLEERWYPVGPDVTEGQLEVLIQDPDGYLLRFVQPLGSRPA